MFDELFGEKLWGKFGTAHGIAALVAIFAIVAIYFAIRKKTKRNQILVLFFISLLGLISVIYNLFSAEDMLNALPLDWWAISAILLPVAILTRGKLLCNVQLLWSLSSLLRILFLDITGPEWFNVSNILALVTDVVGAGLVILLFELKLVERDHKLLKPVIAVTSLVYFAMCITNIMLGTNYMLTANPEGNVILSFIYSIFGVPHWYMLLAIPLAMLYMYFWYLPEILDDRKKNKNLKAKLKDLDRYYEEYEEEYIDEIIEEKYD